MLKAERPSARLLDVSRLVSRAGRVLTGIDRVELAYLHAVIDDDAPAYGISRTALGYVLLDETGLNRLVANIEQDHWPQPDLVSRLNPRLSPAARLGQTAVRSMAIGRAAPLRLRQLMMQHIPKGVRYLNVGHSNLTDRVLNAVKLHPESHIAVMVHDTIPLDYPDFQREGSVPEVEGRLRRVASYADLVIAVTKSESRNIARHLRHYGRVPDILAAHIGVEDAVPAYVPEALLEEPFFMTVGTIEPRKNHALLLDIWDKMGAEAPRLLICGSRGWRNEAVFARLDRENDRIVELDGLSDGAVRTLLERTNGFLFPSFAEGFGLPPAEALLAGAPVVCSDLPACREILGSKAVYLDPSDRYQWEKAVKDLLKSGRSGGEQPKDLPMWENHFKKVFTKT